MGKEAVRGPEEGREARGKEEEEESGRARARGEEG
jgi:hypothetical protein